MYVRVTVVSYHIDMIHVDITCHTAHSIAHAYTQTKQSITLLTQQNKTLHDIPLLTHDMTDTTYMT